MLRSGIDSKDYTKQEFVLAVSPDGSLSPEAPVKDEAMKRLAKMGAISASFHKGPEGEWVLHMTLTEDMAAKVRAELADLLK